MNHITTLNQYNDGITCFGPASTYEAGPNAYKGEHIVLEDQVVDLAGVQGQDGGIDCVDGASVTLRRCVVRNVGKASLVGNADMQPPAAVTVEMHDCVVENFGRRAPEAQCGAQVLMVRCTIRNWGVKSSFDVKAFGALANGTGTKIRAVNCRFEQGGFWQTGFWNFFVDLGNHIGQAVKDRGVLGLTWRDFIPGVCRGLTAVNGGEVEAIRCTKNKWWIVIDG